MMKIISPLLLVTILWCSCTSSKQEDQKRTEEPLHIVFVIGDEEYRSEESMPMLARILNRELGAKISLCYSVDSAGFVDPNRLDYIEGLEALETADLAVFFMRFRALPEDQLQLIQKYVESGKPIVGFRTSTHAFLYKEDSSLFYMNNEWPTQVFGQQWITHHGHFDDGNSPLTAVSMIDSVDSNILNGVEPFNAYSWLYHVDGGDWQLHGDSQPLLLGTALRSNHEEKNRLDEFSLTNPVAWTKSYGGSKVFFTTLGHPYDFKLYPMRKLALNGIYWALNMDVPKEGINATIVGDYQPSNSGFGQKFKAGQRPLQIP